MKTLIALLLLCAVLPAQVYKVNAHLGGTRKEGTCVCIGADSEQSYFLTAAHVVNGARDITIKNHRVDVIAQEYTDGVDIAVLALRGFAPEHQYHVGKDPEQGAVLVGCRLGGPRVARSVRHQKGGWYECSEDVCDGDSGGPIVTADGRVVGIVNSITSPRCGREVYATVNVAKWIQNNCPQCIAPQYRVHPVPGRVRFQPPVVVEPPSYVVEPLAPRPLQEPLPQPTPAPAKTVVDYERLADVVFAKYGRQLKGETGPPGPMGQNGANGEAGTSPSETEVKAAVAAYLQANPLPSPSLPSRRFLIVDGKNIIDDEVYGPADPVVLDVRKLTKNAD